MTRYSLRTRLVAVVVAVTVFALSAGGFATWLALRQYLYGGIDGQIHHMAEQRAQRLNNHITLSGDIAFDSASDAQNALLGPGPGGGPSDGPGQTTVIDATGKVPSAISTLESEDVVDSKSFDYILDLASDDAKDLLQHPGETMDITTTDGQTMRVVSTKLDNGMAVAVGVSVSGVQSTLRHLIVLELAVGSAAVLGAIGLGAYGVRVGLDPLTRVSHTAREIAANLKSHGSGLERRVPPSDPRTEVGQLTDAVNTMLGAAQVAYAQRVENEDRMRRFLADASHELRTPLTSLRGYAELERLRAATPGAEDADATKDAFRRIEVEGDRMARLVDDLLLLARTDQGSAAPEFGPVPVDELLDEAADRAGAAFPSRPFVVDTPNTGLLFQGDREVMLQVLGNLLRNAAIHTPGPRPIRLGARPDGNSVLLLIADEGPGMPPDQAQHAFERFWRADSGRTRATGGSGLGLAIVHALVTSQSGAVGLTSDVATGTTVLVRMPGVVDGLGRLVHQPVAESRGGQGGNPVAQPGRFVAQSAASGPMAFDAETTNAGSYPEVLEGRSSGQHAEDPEGGRLARARSGRTGREPGAHRSWWNGSDHSGDDRTP